MPNLIGEELYNLYAKSAIHLPNDIRRGEQLPHWNFLPGEQRTLWNDTAKRVSDWIEGEPAIVDTKVFS